MSWMNSYHASFGMLNKYKNGGGVVKQCYLSDRKLYVILRHSYVETKSSHNSKL